MQKNLEVIKANLRKEKQANPKLVDPHIIAVSKKQSVEKIRQLFDLGQVVFAENYLQEVLEKQQQLVDLPIEWHFIGQLQSKKINDIVGRFHLLHSVWREKEITKISQACVASNIHQDYLLQVNIAEEPSKQGIAPSEVGSWVKDFSQLPGARLRGLMVFPPLEDSEEKTLQWFSRSYQIFQNWQRQLGPSFDCLSMGTSHDYSLAYRAGATHLRLGETLMGPRD